MIDKYRLEIALFVSGAVVMILGLVGYRIVTPYLGASAHVWSILMGAILTSLSLGYGLGGRIADRNLDGSLFSRLILLAALLLGVVSMVQEPVLREIRLRIVDTRLAAVAAGVILFAPAAVVLGMITPCAARLKIRALDRAGTTVGRLHAVSTVGGAAGIFLSAFFLLPCFGSGNLMWALSLVLLVVSVTTSRKKPPPIEKTASAVLILCLLWSWWAAWSNRGPQLVDTDTRYQRLIVGERFDKTADRFIRYLRTNRDWDQPAVVVGRPETLFQRHNRFFRLADHFLPNNQSALLIGGGAGTFARDYLSRHPRGTIQMVEIDPTLIRLAKSYFYLAENRRLEIYYEDGRVFLNRTTAEYDVIFMDIFSAAASPPFHIVTREALQLMAGRLKPGGLVMASFYSAIEGPSGRFFRAALATFRHVFSQVLVFPVVDPDNGRKTQHLIIAAFRDKNTVPLQSRDPEQSAYLAHRWKKEIPADVPVLRDDFAPVAHYLSPVLNAGGE